MHVKKTVIVQSNFKIKSRFKQCKFLLFLVNTPVVVSKTRCCCCTNSNQIAIYVGSFCGIIWSFLSEFYGISEGISQSVKTF